MELGNLSNIKKSRPFFHLGLFALVWFVVPSGWKIATKSNFSEFHAPIWEVGSRMQDISHYWGHLTDSKRTLIEKGKQMQRRNHGRLLQLNELETLEAKGKRLRLLQSEISALEKELKIDAERTFVPVVARVSLRSLSAWWQEIFLRKGLTEGLGLGMGVIFKGGMLGRITTENQRSSGVELITNPSFRIVAHFSGDDRPVTFQGNGILPGGDPLGIVFDVPQDMIASRENPLQLMSSSLGKSFPRGIPIGWVIELEGDEDGLFKTGLVYLDNELTKVQEVTVLLPIE